MIQLTRLNNRPLVVNSDQIKFVENAPDTFLTLLSGEKIVVRETTEQVLAKVIEFRRKILQGLTWNCGNVGVPSSLEESDQDRPPSEKQGNEEEEE
ncbi:MAG: flagellar FlbD family protein [Acidobacteriia bacterium]|nr:flagellar FlbD family protein [Terriglobia bacterium]